MRITLRQPHVSRRWGKEDLLERDDVRIELELEREPGVPLPSVVAYERIGRLGEREVELRLDGRARHEGSYRLDDVPRGRHRFEPVRLSIADPFGLAEARLTLDDRQTLVVYPRLVELERLFFDGGAGPEHGRRLLLRRPVGFDLHSVRDYQQGESLRRVHWPSTARRGSLMVKELEDSPRDEVAVLLDGDPGGVTGSPPDSSFDVAVRAAGSILRAQVRSGRRCVLLLNNAARDIAGHLGGRAGVAPRARAARGGRARRPEPGGLAASLGRRTGLALARARGRHLPGRAVARRPAARARAHAPRRRARPRRGGELRGRPAPAGSRAPAPAGARRAGRRRAPGGRSRRRAARRETVGGGAWVGRDGRSRVSAPALVVVARGVAAPRAARRVAATRARAPPARARRRPPARPLDARPSRPWSRPSSRRASRLASISFRGGSTVRASAFGLSHAFSPLGTRFGNGFDDFYSTHLPFDPRVHVAMHELVLSGVFVFALGVALLVAARKPVAAALVLLLGAGWPATLLGPSRGIAMGAAILGGALVLLAGLGSRRRAGTRASGRPWSWPSAAIVVGSATAARHGLVHWQTWNLAHVAIGPTDVGFVWNAQYGGLRFSGHPTNVLQVQSAAAPTYLRATVLDDFRDNAWAIGAASPGRLAGACGRRRPENQTPEIVTVDALADTHLVGGSIPMRFVAAGGAPLVRSGPGFAALDQNLPQGFRYTAWSYTPPAERGGAPRGRRRTTRSRAGERRAARPSATT